MKHSNDKSRAEARKTPASKTQAAKRDKPKHVRRLDADTRRHRVYVGVVLAGLAACCVFATFLTAAANSDEKAAMTSVLAENLHTLQNESLVASDGQASQAGEAAGEEGVDEEDVSGSADSASAAASGESSGPGSSSEPGGETSSETSNKAANKVVLDPNDPRLTTSTSRNTKKPNKHVVYLTFDDGPSPNTPKILEILDKHGVKATWFVMGSGTKLDYLDDIWNAGHQVGLHTYSHNYTKIYKNSKAFFKDMHKIGNAVNKRLGFTPTIIRFPGGSKNSFNTKTFKKIAKALNKHDIHYFDWNASVADATSVKPRSPKALYATARKTSANKDSVCLLMHDTAAKPTTVKALKKIIRYYKRHGFEFDYLTADSFGYHL